MYYILDKELNPAGILQLDGKGCPFYSDLRTVQIEDDSNGKLWNDTLTLTVPDGYPEYSMMAEGYHLLMQDESDSLWYCFRINDVTDQPVGQGHVKIVSAINLCMWDLSHTITTATTLTNVTSQDVFTYILQRTGWTIGQNEWVGSSKSLEISLGDTAQSALQNACQTLPAEIRAYVNVENGKIVSKCIDIFSKLGSATGRRIEYSKNLLDITREMQDDNVYTLLHVYGGTPSNSDNPVNIASVNGGRDYIVDDDANDKYNGGQTKYLEGWVQNESILNKNGLLDWGKEELEYYNHVRYLYTVSVSQLDWNPELGDTVQLVDFDMEPELTVSARVIQKQMSQADPTQNQVVLGEFVTIEAVTPDAVKKIQSTAAAAARAAATAATPTFVRYAPDGLDFKSKTETKRLIVRAYSNKQEVTYQLSPEQFVWEKIDADGTHDTDWETAHKDSGNVILVDYSVVDQTIRCVYSQNTDVISRPSYFTSGTNGLTNVSNRVTSLQNDNTLSIIFVTDTHYATGGYSNPTLTIRSVDHLRNVAALTQQAKIDLVVHGGDMTDGASPKYTITDDQMEAAGSLHTNCDAPIFFINGNHDDASWYASKYANNDYDEVLTPDDRYTILSPYIGTDFQLNSGYENRLYGYMDFSTQKIRVICLNDFENPYIRNSDGTNKYKSQYTAGIMQDQLTWLTDVALQVPDDSWAVCFFMHQRYAVSLNADYKNINFNLLDGIIDAFHNGKTFSGQGTTTDYTATVSVDFTGHPHDIIGVFHGHIHEDVQHDYNGINLIATLDCLARNDYPGSMPDRPYPSLAEDAWDVITIDRSSRKIHMTRFGAGSDREYSY